MKKQYFFLVFLLLFMSYGNASIAQIVGTDCFLQGHWLEIGVDQMGAFGTCTSPAGYHPHTCYCTTTCTSPSGELDAAYDWGHDGWAIGSPCMMGNYTIPGYPQEGWSIQVGATEYRNWAGGGVCTGPFTVPGSITGYSNSGGTITGTFTGNVVGLHIVQETRVDTTASWVVVTTKIYNTTGAAITGVYYERTCDPDNVSMWGGGSSTENVIVHQNEDARHDVMIGTYATTSSGGITFNRYNSYMALATKDCRAKCGVIPGLAPSNTPAQLWAGTGTVITALGDSNNMDEGIFLVFNIGTIAALGSPGDSAVVSYAYIYDGNDGIDSALPDPALTIGGSTAFPPRPFPGVVVDTYNACANPGITVVPVDLPFAGDKTWTWSTWTWSPATGLSATTGIHTTITIAALPPVITYTITGTDPATCGTRTMLLTILACNNVRANTPCYGDTLFLRRVGDSTGCTYYWYGPGGYTSTQQDPFIYPATYADTGKFYAVRTFAGLHDTDSITVYIHDKPIVTASNNAPLCLGIVDTLQLNVSPTIPGETFIWSGPAAFASGIQNPIVPGFGPPNVGTYRVIVTTVFGCKDTSTTFADTITRPLPPTITDQSYCQYQPFVPFTITGLAPGGIVLWYISATGGTGSTTPWVPVNTSVPGIYKNYFTQKNGSCESIRDSISVLVKPTPIAPVVTGPTQYCQYIGPIVPLTVTPLDSIRWYTVPAGGVPAYIEPIPNINTAGAYNYWVTQTVSGCESPATAVTINVWPKPAPPVVTPQSWCQYWVPASVSVAPSGAGDVLTWYGPGVTAGYLVAPLPNTSIAPDTIVYYITETTSHGCISDSARDAVVIKVKPPAPLTKTKAYCQGDPSNLLNELVDSLFGSHLDWYLNTAPIPNVRPNTDTVPGIYTWWASQVVNGCQSDSAAVNVTIIYKPVFSIDARPWVCQFDSIMLAYSGPSLFEPGYYWTLPVGAFAINGTNIGDSQIIVKFDSANQNSFVVYLRASDDSGFCASDTNIHIKVVPQPTMIAYTKPDICVGDTTDLALSSRSSDAYDYKWYVDHIVMTSSGALNIISSNSSSGGPFSISWLDTGLHIIMVTSTTQEGCKSLPTYDSVEVHQVPDASFKIIYANGSLCIEDSVEFRANTQNYNYSYVWAPAHDFNNINKPDIWGKMEAAHNQITLTVTDPFGCYATQSMEVDPGSCCMLLFPNAFTPNGDGKNDWFEPNNPTFHSGYHRFHMFRIANRWGQTIFESANSADARWDGNYNGVPQDMGVYYYYVKYDCGGQTLEQKGDVTLIR